MSTENRTEESHEQRFVSALQELAEQEDRATLAALRRGLGEEPGTITEMFPFVMRHAGRIDKRRQDDYFLVAALFAGHGPSAKNSARQFWADGDREYQRNFGASFRVLRQKRETSEGPEQRFKALLACHPDDLPRHLRHAVSLLAADEVAIDWAKLLGDLQYWGHPDRWVQRAWANAFWASTREEEPAGAQNDAVPETTN